ncbi:olfactory receptor 2AP1-like [Pseudophryne corroboree]|uniref:olfactory receptor 2AP1-like n=1 Tax=Pseudophryne corroboree TaxID=495146 RepID=UPI00308164C1
MVCYFSIDLGQLKTSPGFISEWLLQGEVGGLNTENSYNYKKFTLDVTVRDCSLESSATTYRELPSVTPDYKNGSPNTRAGNGFAGAGDSIMIICVSYFRSLKFSSKSNQWKALNRIPVSKFYQAYTNGRSDQDLNPLNSDTANDVGLQNQTPVTYFIIKGISDVPELQALVFLVVLAIYLITVSGNSTILLLVCLDPHLHTPMYFFLGNLSFLDVFCLTITLHKILLSYMMGDKTVSFINCMSQLYLFSSLTCNELLLLTAMSYDRYVAICNPFHYHAVMNRQICILLASVCWILGFVEVIPHMWAISRFSCYKSNEINHYFCDILPIMKLSCSDTTLLKLIIFVEGLLLVSFTPFLLTFISYVFIIATILRIRSSFGRRKAFYTCSSHLTVVILLYMSLVCQYLRPSSTDTLNSNKLFSLFNTAAVPVLNPFIYSLKNKDVKSAVRRQLKWLMSV